MLVTISTTTDPAADLGFLRHKRPGKAQSFAVAAGTAHVFYPEATARRCTAALLLDVDPVPLVRSPRGQAAESFTLGQYVNDRSYAASSMLAVALSRVTTDEVDKLVRAGRGWLAAHPGRYLAHQAGMQTAGPARLAEVDDSPAEAIDNATDEPRVTGEPDRAQSLAGLRVSAVLAVLRAAARSVADLGCGAGRLLADPAFTRAIGTGVPSRALALESEPVDRRL